MRILLLLLLSCARCFAQSTLYEIDSSNTVVGWGFRNAAQPGNTLVTVPMANITKNLTDDSGLANTVYRYVGGFVVLRTALDLAQERAVVARIAAKRQFMAWRQTLTTARHSLALSPGDAFFQAQVSQAASQVTSYASQASIPVTTATTQ